MYRTLPSLKLSRAAEGILGGREIDTGRSEDNKSGKHGILQIRMLFPCFWKPPVPGWQNSTSRRKNESEWRRAHDMEVSGTEEERHWVGEMIVAKTDTVYTELFGQRSSVKNLAIKDGIDVEA